VRGILSAAGARLGHAAGGILRGAPQRRRRCSAVSVSSAFAPAGPYYAFVLTSAGTTSPTHWAYSYAPTDGRNVPTGTLQVASMFTANAAAGPFVAADPALGFPAFFLQGQDVTPSPTPTRVRAGAGGCTGIDRSNAGTGCRLL